MIITPKAAAQRGMLVTIILLLASCSSELNNKLVTAAGDGDTAQVKTLIQQGADVNHKLIDTGTSPLISAARRGHLEVVKVLLAGGANINLIDYGVGTALYWAANDGQLEMIKFLIDHGAKLGCKPDSASYLLRIIREKGYREVEALVAKQLELEGIKPA